MRHLFTIFLFLISTIWLKIYFQSVSHDRQWLISNGYGKSDYRNHLNVFEFNLTNDTNFHLSVVRHPDGRITNPKPENDFFVIFNDGTYNIGRTNSYGTYVHTNTNYNFRTLQPIKYMYLTNRYEEEDPPQLVKVTNNINDNLQVESLLPFSDGRYLVNHDIKDSTDIVFIINKNLLDSFGTYKICFSSDSPLQGLKFHPKTFNFRTSNTLTTDSNGNFYDPAIHRFVENCLDFNFYGRNIFMNFEIKLNNESLIDKVVNFTLHKVQNGKVGENLGEYKSERIVGIAHDPNYIELLCAWESRGKKYAKYRVECFNNADSTGVDNLSMSLFLPTQYVSNSLKLNKWNIGGKKGCDSTGYNKPKFTIFNDTLNIDFNSVGGLSNYNNTSIEDSIALFTAWFEFCIELDSSTNLEQDYLGLSIPRTSFDNNLFAIEEFRDKIICDKKDPCTRILNRCCCSCNRLSCIVIIIKERAKWIISVVIGLFGYFFYRNKKKKTLTISTSPNTSDQNPLAKSE